MIPNLFKLDFKLDYLSGFVSLAGLIFFALVMLYSLRFMKLKARLFEYYSWMTLTVIASVGAALANNLILLLVLWGFLGFTLYMLINIGEKGSDAAAKKTFIIVGGSDCLMLLGIGIVYYLTGTFQMDKIKIDLTASPNLLPLIAYLCLALASFAKAGAMPFHSWIPDSAETAPIPAVAFLPAALDKLLGIYLLARISLNLFEMNQLMNILLMSLGAFTIIAAVMMALIQHNFKRLLGYHAVSQVGYMVLGIGSGHPIGIAGALFHMLNNAVYKSCLFLGAGNVEQQTGTAELDRLGGLSKAMPVTYISMLIASLAISGIPPLNGFVSKWMIYQGVISRLQDTGFGMRAVAGLCLFAAMIGSALTLASFMKLLHATFLGQPANTASGGTPPFGGGRPKEVPWQMWFPVVGLAAICIIFGVFAYQLPLKYLIFPALSTYQRINLSTFPGFWSPGLATTLIIIGLILGLIVFKLSRLKLSFRQDSPFVGGEELALAKNRVSGVEFYNTVKDINILGKIYKLAERKYFDIYELGQRLVFSLTRLLRYLHNGVLPTYLVWCLLGMMAMFFIMSR